MVSSISNEFYYFAEITPININTAPKRILASLGNGLSETQVEELIQERKKGIREFKGYIQTTSKTEYS